MDLNFLFLNFIVLLSVCMCLYTCLYVVGRSASNLKESVFSFYYVILRDGTWFFMLAATTLSS